jgi:hypothetical protein
MARKIRQIIFGGVGGLTPDYTKYAIDDLVVNLKYNGALYHVHVENERVYGLTSKRESKKTTGLNEKLSCFPTLKKETIPCTKETILVAEAVAEHLGKEQGVICGFVAGIMNSSAKTLAEKFPYGHGLKLVVHDILYFEGKSFMSRTYGDVENHLGLLNDNLQNSPLPIAGFFGDKLKSIKGTLAIVSSQPVASVLNAFGKSKSITGDYFAALQEIVDSPKFKYEGFVVKDLNSRLSLKVLKQRNIDVIITGFTPGKNKYTGQVGAIQIGVLTKEAARVLDNRTYITPSEVKRLIKQEQIISVGNVAGIDNDRRLDMTNHPNAYLGRIITVKYKHWTGEKLFHPRIDNSVGFRDDKLLKRCTLRQIKEG